VEEQFREKGCKIQDVSFWKGADSLLDNLGHGTIVVLLGAQIRIACQTQDLSTREKRRAWADELGLHTHLVPDKAEEILHRVLVLPEACRMC